MSGEEVNGIAKAPTVAEVHQWMESWIKPICIGAVNGILRTMPQIPLDEVMIMTCRWMGFSIGGTLSVGDLSPLLQLRARCKEAFNEGMSKAPIRPAPTQATGLDQDLLSKVAQGRA
jgi:hypothetical protein